MVLLHKTYFNKGRERNLWVYWVSHKGFGKPRFFKEKITDGHPWECYAYGFTWGKLEAYIAKNTYSLYEKRKNKNLVGV